MSEYQQQLGERLRSIRNQQGLTLQDVEERSNGTWKAVVIGSYERGDRAVSVSKLSDLARFYGVPMRELLPESDTSTDEPTGATPRVVLDLTRIPSDEEPDEAIAALSRYARRIQVQRGDYNGRMLSLRADDLKALAIAFDREPDELITELETREAILIR